MHCSTVKEPHARNRNSPDPGFMCVKFRSRKAMLWQPWFTKMLWQGDAFPWESHSWLLPSVDTGQDLLITVSGSVPSQVCKGIMNEHLRVPHLNICSPLLYSTAPRFIGFNITCWISCLESRFYLTYTFILHIRKKKVSLCILTILWL